MNVLRDTGNCKYWKHSSHKPDVSQSISRMPEQNSALSIYLLRCHLRCRLFPMLVLCDEAAPPCTSIWTWKYRNCLCACIEMEGRKAAGIWRGHLNRVSAASLGKKQGHGLGCDALRAVGCWTLLHCECCFHNDFTAIWILCGTVTLPLDFRSVTLRNADKALAKSNFMTYLMFKNSSWRWFYFMRNWILHLVSKIYIKKQ